MTSSQQRAELQRRIWGIANEVRGAVDGWDFKQYVLGSLFYRFISENFAAYIEGGDDSFRYAQLADSVITPEIKDEAVKTKGYFIYPSQLASVAGRMGADFNAPVRYSLTTLELGAGGAARQHFQFAQAVSASYIQVAKETLAEALSVGYSEYVTEVHRRLFGLRTPESELLTRVDKIRKFKAAIQKYAVSTKVRATLAARALGDRATIQAAVLDYAMKAASVLNEATEDLAVEFIVLYDQGNASGCRSGKSMGIGAFKGRFGRDSQLRVQISWRA